MAQFHNKDAVALTLIIPANEENMQHKGGLYGANGTMKM